MIMDSAKNGRWIIPFKTFGMMRVKKSGTGILLEKIARPEAWIWFGKLCFKKRTFIVKISAVKFLCLLSKCFLFFVRLPTNLWYIGYYDNRYLNPWSWFINKIFLLIVNATFVSFVSNRNIKTFLQRLQILKTVFLYQ